MPHPLLRFALLVAALSTAPGAGHAQVRDSADLAAIIRRSELHFAAAIIARDTTALSGVTWPQFACVSPDSVLTPLTRAAWFAAVKASGIQPFSPRNIIVRVFSRRPPWHRWADLAIASYVADVRTASNSASDGTSRAKVVFVTDTWRLDGDRWRMIERSASTAGAAAAK
jgi:hypothetical protein